MKMLDREVPSNLPNSLGSWLKAEVLDQREWGSDPKTCFLICKMWKIISFSLNFLRSKQGRF